MPWNSIVPKIGRHPPAIDVVTVAPNKSQNRKTPSVRISFSRGLVASMGWKKGTVINVQHDPEQAIVRFRKAAEGERGFILFIPEAGKGGMARMSLPIPGQGHGDNEKTITVRHAIDGEYIAFRLPEWLITPVRIQPKVRAV